MFLTAFTKNIRKSLARSSASTTRISRTSVKRRVLACEPLEERQLLTVWGPWFEFDTWNQNPSPYWDDTPIDPVSGRQTYVGCVATAAAQVLQYWKYPDTIDFDAADGYTTRTHRINIDGDAGTNGFSTLAQLDASLSQIDYDLSNQEIADIGFGVGVKYEMNYGNYDVGGRTRGSGTWTSWGERVFREDFGFGSARWDTWSPSVEADVIENLKAGWPVMLSIGVAGQSGGHAVVLEGYRDDDTKDFYVNFGWGGAADDWYDLPDIGNFDVVRGAVYDISPTHGWGQTLANAENTSFSPYAIPDVSTEKWHQSTDGNHRFEGVLAGTGANVYVTNTSTFPGVTSSLWVISNNGVKLDEIPLPEAIDENNGIGYPAQASNGKIFIPTDDGAIYEVDLKTRSATKIFQDPATEEITSIKIDEDGLLYFSTNSTLYSVDQAGTKQWEYAVPSGGKILRSEPAVDDVRDRVYLPYYVSSGAMTSHLAVIDRTNGNLLYTENFGTVLNNNAAYSAGTPSIDSDGTIYVGNYTSLYALNPDSTLTEKWPHITPGVGLITDAPTIGRDGTVYIHYRESNPTTDYSLAAVDPDTGSTRELTFQLGYSDSIGAILAGSNDMIVFGISRDSGPAFTLYAYEDTGTSFQKQWERESGAVDSVALGPDNTLYLLPAGVRTRITAIGSGLGRGADNNSAPSGPDNTGVPDFSTVDNSSVVLSWNTSDPEGDDLTYTVWGREGGNDSEYILASNITETSYAWSDLEPGKQYSWYVIASDGQAVTDSEAWTFATEGSSTPRIDVELVVASGPTAEDVASTLPASQSSVIRGQTFYVEVWAKNIDGSGDGIVGGYLDFSFDSSLVSGGSINHGGFFTNLTIGTVDNPSGLIDDLGGMANPGVIDKGDDEWVRLGYVSFTATASGEAVFTTSPGIARLARSGEGEIDWNNVDLNNPPATVRIAVNRPPVLGVIGPQTINEETELTFTATATDPDIPVNGLTFSLDVGAPAGASINPVSGVFTWTPTEAQGPGGYDITVRVTDNGTAVLDDFETITVTVPVLPTLSIADVSLEEGDSGMKDFTFTVSLSQTSSQDVTVQYATADGTAKAGEDYTAANGQVTIPAWQTSATIPVAILGDSDVEPDETFTLSLFNPVGATIADGVATGTIQDDETPPLGPTDFVQLNDLVIPAGGLRYELETTRDGLLTVEAAFAGSADSIAITLLDADGNPVASSTLVDGKHRIDWQVSAGQSYSVTVTGINVDVDLTIANLVQHDGTTVTVSGTGGDDTFAFAPTGSYRVTINGIAYHFDETAVDTVQFNGGSGHDDASIEDSEGDDVYTATRNYVLMEAPEFTVRADYCSTVHAYARNGGVDTALLYSHIWRGVKNKCKAEDGTTVKLYDSDRWYYNRVKFFETVRVKFLGDSPRNEARLWDSSASDIFDGRPGNGRYYSENTAFDVTVLDADFMTVYSTNGGNDKLILHDSPNDDVFRAKPHKVEMLDRDTGGEVYKITARKFTDVTAYADQGGRDIAKLYDSTLDDLWEAEYRQGETWSKMTSASRALYEALAFEQVKGYSVNGGQNRVQRDAEVDFVLKYAEPGEEWIE